MEHIGQFLCFFCVFVFLPKAEPMFRGKVLIPEIMVVKGQVYLPSSTI